MTAIAGIRGSGDFATDERPKNFREYILWRNPNGSAPLTALLSKMGSDSTDDPEINWWDEPQDIWRGQINGAVGGTAADTILTIDSADPSTSSPGLNWGLAKHLVPGDVLMRELGTGETTAFANEHMLVTNIISDTQIQVQRGFAGTTIAAISNDDYILHIGKAYAEGSAAPRTANRQPMKYTNYCQIWKTVYEMTKTAAATRMRTGDPLRNDKKRKAFDHSRALELSLIFGKKSESNDPVSGKPLRTVGGIRSFIPTSNQKIYSAAVSFNTFLDDVHKVFDWDSEAGDQRIGFCGNLGLNELNKIAESSGLVQFGPTVSVYGMKLRELIFPQGSIFLRTHPLFNRNSLYSKSLLVIDPTALKWRPLRDTKSEDDIQEKKEDKKMGQWLTEASLEVRYGGLTCGYFGNLSAT